MCAIKRCMRKDGNDVVMAMIVVMKRVGTLDSAGMIVYYHLQSGERYSFHPTSLKRCWLYIKKVRNRATNGKNTEFNVWTEKSPTNLQDALFVSWLIKTPGTSQVYLRGRSA